MISATMIKVVNIAPISVTNITGLAAIRRGFNMAKASRAATETSVPSNIAALRLPRRVLEEHISFIALVLIIPLNYSAHATVSEGTPAPLQNRRSSRKGRAAWQGLKPLTLIRPHGTLKTRRPDFPPQGQARPQEERAARLQIIRSPAARRQTEEYRYAAYR